MEAGVCEGKYWVDWGGREGREWTGREKSLRKEEVPVVIVRGDGWGGWS